MTFPLSKFLPVLLFMPVLFALSGAAQEPEDRKTQKPESMGVATGTPHAPVRDALSRPITAGGFVDGAPVVFTDITKQAGLAKFLHRSGGPEKATILETPGSGVAFSGPPDRKSTRLNSSHGYISYAVFCLKKKKKQVGLFWSRPDHIV